MGTQFETENGEVLAKRMSQGRGNKPAFCVFFTEAEFDAWRGVACAPETDPSDMTDLESWVRVHAPLCDVKFLQASDLNRMAAELESHRWAPMFEADAAEMRARARQATRDSLSVV